MFTVPNAIVIILMLMAILIALYTLINDRKVLTTGKLLNRLAVCGVPGSAIAATLLLIVPTWTFPTSTRVFIAAQLIVGILVMRINSVAMREAEAAKRRARAERLHKGGGDHIGNP